MLNWGRFRHGASPGSGASGLLVVPGLVLIGVTFLLPLAYLVTLSVTEPALGLDNYVRIFTVPAYLTSITYTIGTALAVTALALLLGYPVAYRLAAASPRVVGLLLIAVGLPYFVSYLIRTYAWMVILGRQGVINRALLSTGIIEQPLQLMFNTLGVYVGMVHVMTPVMILVLFGVMRGIDRSLVVAARSLGASPASAFLRVYLPLSLPGIGSGCLLVFILSIGFYITPTLLGNQSDVMIASLIVTQVNVVLNWGFAAALSIAVLVFVGVTYLVVNPLTGFDRAILAGAGADTGASRSGAPFRRARGVALSLQRIAMAILSPIGLGLERLVTGVAGVVGKLGVPAGKIISWLFTAAVLFYLIAPVLIVIPLSFSSASFLTFPPPGYSLRWYENYFNDKSWIDATIFSLQVAALAVIFALILGLLATVALVRGQFLGKRATFILFILPLVVPEIITAVGVYFVFARVHMTGTLPGFVLAHTLLAIPFVVLVVAPALRGLDARLEQAARSLGAAPLTVFRLVTFPLIRASIIAAALFGFLASFDNLLLALFLSGADAITLPIKMWQDIRLEINPRIAAVSTLEILLSALIMLVAGQLQQRRT